MTSPKLATIFMWKMEKAFVFEVDVVLVKYFIDVWHMLNRDRSTSYVLLTPPLQTTRLARHIVLLSS